MNRGALAGIGNSRGAYPQVTGPASWGGNRGRTSVDELRMWGYPDNGGGGSNNNFIGAGRYLNTNWLAPALYATNSAFSPNTIDFPQDIGAIINILSGVITINGGSGGWSTMYNTAGTIQCGPLGGSIGSCYESNTKVTNIPGVASAIFPLGTMGSGITYIAEGAACTITNHSDFYTESIFTTGSLGTGTLGTLAVNSSTAFSAHASVSTNVTLTTSTGFRLKAMTLSGTGNSVTNAYGVDIDLQPVVTTTSNAIRINGTSPTLTAGLPGASAMIDIWPGTTTLNFSNTTIPSAFVNASGTVQVAQSASGFGLMANGTFRAGLTFKNSTTVAANLAQTVGFIANPVFQADGASITIGTNYGFQSNLTANVSNAGTVSAGTLIGYQSNATVGSGATITLLEDFLVAAPTISGTLTTHVGLTIPSLTGATTNIGIKIAGNANPIQLTETTTGPTTGNLTSNSNMVMTVYAGSGGTNYYLLFAWNDGGTVRYKYMLLNGTGTTWSEGTSLPT